MPILGKAAGTARNFLGSDAGQALMRTVSGFIPGDPYGYVLAQQARDKKLDQQQQQRDAIQGLLAQIQPDTYTPQVNELIGEANMAGRGRFDPMAPMTPKGPAFDFTSPQGQAALLNALGAGVSLDGISGLRDFISPKRNTTKLGEGDALYDDEGNLIAQGRVKPPAPERPLVVPQGGSVFWPGQRLPGFVAPKTYAPPRATGGGGGGGAMTPRPTGKVY